MRARPKWLRGVIDGLQEPPSPTDDDWAVYDRLEYNLALSVSATARYFDELAIQRTGRARPLPRRHSHG